VAVLIVDKGAQFGALRDFAKELVVQLIADRLLPGRENYLYAQVAYNCIRQTLDNLPQLLEWKLRY
jgi:hypothetical protein